MSVVRGGGRDKGVCVNKIKIRRYKMKEKRKVDHHFIGREMQFHDDSCTVARVSGGGGSGWYSCWYGRWGNI